MIAAPARYYDWDAHAQRLVYSTVSAAGDEHVHLVEDFHKRNEWSHFGIGGNWNGEGMRGLSGGSNHGHILTRQTGQCRADELVQVGIRSRPLRHQNHGPRAVKLFPPLRWLEIQSGFRQNRAD